MNTKKKDNEEGGVILYACKLVFVLLVKCPLYDDYDPFGGAEVTTEKTFEDVKKASITPKINAAFLRR